MIEINLLPGARRKSRARGGAGGASFGAAMSGAVSRVKDPYLLGTLAAVVLAVAAVGVMYVTQAAHARDVDARLEQALADSTRFARTIVEKRRVEAQRDSVVQQLDLIREIDDKRYTWSHVLDEVSRALPPYTWLTQVAQTNTTEPPAIIAAADTGKDLTQAERDSMKAERDKVTFRIIGETVDLQALTRFMTLLEASPFIQNVQLVRTGVKVVETTEINEFQLDAEYEKPAPGVVRTQPIRLATR